MKQKKLLAVASAGGHWVQLRRMAPAFSDFDTVWMSTTKSLPSDISKSSYVNVRDASMWDKLGLLIMSFQVAWCVFKFRPDVVVSTGAATGFFALVFGRICGAKTIWIDSVANAQELSLAGKKVKPWATHWLTQWPELEKESGPKYLGAVL